MLNKNRWWIRGIGGIRVTFPNATVAWWKQRLVYNYTHISHTHTHATFLYTRARVYRKVIIYNLLWICYFLSAIILWYSVCKIVAPYDVNSGTVIWHHVVWTVRRSYDLRSYQNHIGELAKKKKSQRAQLEQT